MTCVEIQGTIGEIAVTDTGTAWVATDDRLWQWTVSQPPRPIAIVAPIERIFWSGRLLIGVTRAQFAVLGDDEPRFLALSAIRVVESGTSEWLVGLTAQRDSVAIHVATGQQYALPVPRNSSVRAPIARGNTVVVQHMDGAEWSASVWDFPVPSDPQALRAWLTTVTNARPGGSDAVVWP